MTLAGIAQEASRLDQIETRASLLAQVEDRDEDAFKVFTCRYGTPIRRLMRARLKWLSHPDFEEAVQDFWDSKTITIVSTFLARPAREQSSNDDATQPFRKYLYRSVEHFVTEVRRRFKREQENREREEATARDIADGESLEDYFKNICAQSYLEGARTQLTDPQKEVLDLYDDFPNASSGEVAAKLSEKGINITADNVRKIFSRGQKKLAECVVQAVAQTTNGRSELIAELRELGLYTLPKVYDVIFGDRTRLMNAAMKDLADVKLRDTDFTIANFIRLAGDHDAHVAKLTKAICRRMKQDISPEVVYEWLSYAREAFHEKFLQRARSAAAQVGEDDVQKYVSDIGFPDFNSVTQDT